MNTGKKRGDCAGEISIYIMKTRKAQFLRVQHTSYFLFLNSLMLSMSQTYSNPVSIARALSGSVIFNHLIIDAFRVTGFLLVMIGIFQALSSKTTQKNKLDNRTNACTTSEEASSSAPLNNKKRVKRSPIPTKSNIRNSHGNAYIGDTHFNVEPATLHVLPAEKTCRPSNTPPPAPTISKTPNQLKHVNN
jgi:hypothetical protein